MTQVAVAEDKAHFDQSRSYITESFGRRRSSEMTSVEVAIRCCWLLDEPPYQ
jgi:hypothetical protein